MAIFIISAIDISVPMSLKETIEENINEDYRVELNPMCWLISFDGTASQLSSKLVIPNVGLAKALVAHVDNFSGYGPLPIQKWIKANSENSTATATASPAGTATTTATATPSTPTATAKSS